MDVEDLKIDSDDENESPMSVRSARSPIRSHRPTKQEIALALQTEAQESDALLNRPKPTGWSVSW